MGSKQKCVSFSSIGAKILAAATSTERGAHTVERMQSITSSDSPLPSILTIDSHGLYSTATTLHEGENYRSRPTVSRMRDSFESGKKLAIQWIPGTQSITDALTKCNPNPFHVLSQTLVSGFLRKNTFKSLKRASQLST